MSIYATMSERSYTPLEAGTYIARCFSTILLGTFEEEYMGEVKQLTKVRLSWELPTELKKFKEDEGEKPIIISKDFTLSMHEKSNLRKALESWRGKSFTDDEAKKFDITTLLGKPCMLTVMHKMSKQGKNYAVISNVSTVMKGAIIPEQINPNFELNFDNFDIEKFNKLSDFLKDKIRQSYEYKKIINPQENEMPAEKENDLFSF